LKLNDLKFKLRILRNHLTRRAKQAHDVIVGMLAMA
jgi:hypothetical protein